MYHIESSLFTYFLQFVYRLNTLWNMLYYQSIYILPMIPPHTVTKGKEKKTSSFVLVGSNTMTKAGSHSRYLPGDTKQMCGLRVKLTYTFSAAGVSAPIFVSIVKIIQRKMPSCKCRNLSTQRIMHWW